MAIFCVVCGTASGVRMSAASTGGVASLNHRLPGLHASGMGERGNSPGRLPVVSLRSSTGYPGFMPPAWGSDVLYEHNWTSWKTHPEEQGGTSAPNVN